MINLARASLILVLAGSLAAGACGGSEPTPTPDPEGGPLTIRGTERLGWDQQAASTADLGTFRYAIYVDGARSELNDASCTGSAGNDGFPCSARLPSLSAGPHTLEIAAFIVRDGAVTESPRSPPLHVTVSSGLTGPADTRGAEPGTSSEGAESSASSSLRTVVDGLNDPADLVFVPDGRLFVADRDGTIRVVQDGRVDPHPALSLDDGFEGRGSRRVMAMALHPDFERTRLLYLLHTVEGRAGAPVFRLSRYREAAGVLGERAVLLDDIPASSRPGAGAIGFGPDGLLYVGLDDGGDRRRAGSAASLNGKILRLNPDGSTPADQLSRSPVHAAGFGSPCALDWDSTGLLWVTDCRGGPEGRLVAVTARRTNAGRTEYQHGMPQVVSGAVFYAGDAVPQFSNALLVASDEGLLRVRFDSSPLRVASVDRLLRDADPMHAVAVASDGGVFACVGTRIVRIDMASNATGAAPAGRPEARSVR